MAYEQKFLLSLLLTWLIETPVIILVIRYVFRRQQTRMAKIIFAGIIASALTLPYLWFILPVYIASRKAYIIWGELLAIFIEAIVYHQFLKLRLSEAIITSLLANSASLAVGWLY